MPHDIKEEIHLNDIGTVFEATIMDGSAIVDVSSATTKELIFRKPSGAVITQTAVFTTDGTDGKIQYITIASDLDEAGDWKLQGRIILPTGEWRTDVSIQSVYGNL